MARPRKIDSGLVKQAQLLASRTDDIQELRMAQAVLLPALGQMTLKAAAKVIGVGRAAAGADETGRGAGLFVRLETPGRARPIGGRDAAPGGVGRKARSPGQALGAVSAAGSPPLAQSGPRHTTSQDPARPARRMEKKTLPQELEAVLTAQAVRERPIRLMFQDEARFGRMARIRRCWAPAPLRPVVCNGYEREFTYVYGSVSPWHGELDWSLSDKMNTAQMAAFLSQVSQAHPQEFLVMVVDGASSHRAKELIVPENVRLISLPGYSPELNPQEHIWDEVREKTFPNLVLDRMAEVVERLKNGMTTLAADAERVRSITAWPWIVSLNLKAN